ncbi:autotransporter outer membrane beta-barrel domain-containing protein [Brucellaceae bacterium C25G]
MNIINKYNKFKRSIAYNKTSLLIIGTIQVLNINIIIPAHAETITVNPNGYPYNAQSNSGDEGAPGTNKGQSAYTFTTDVNSQPADNQVSVDDTALITGGPGGVGINGGIAGDGGAGLSGSTVTITNNGLVEGGEGGGGDTDDIGHGFAGTGGAAIIGDNLRVINNGNLIGGMGGDNTGGAGGKGGIGISTNNSQITNYNIIQGGNGGASWDNASYGGDAGAAITGNNLTITNGGDIKGGNGSDAEPEFSFNIDYGYDSYGGDGGAGIDGNNLTIKNSGLIVGGNGGTSYGGYGNITGGNGYGGNAGTAISGNHLVITNNGDIRGGKGGEGYSGDHGSDDAFGTGNGGDGGAGIGGNSLTITNSGSITGGKGGYGTTSEDGNEGYGGNGGNGISGNNLTITNDGDIRGGEGGDSDGYGDYNQVQIKGGNAGAAITGNNLTIINNGNIEGSLGGRSNSGDHDGDDSVAIKGSNLTITNNGSIQVSDSDKTTSIEMNYGLNTLTLEANSEISGNVVLSDVASEDTNTLSIFSNEETIINGNLNVGSHADLTLLGKTLTFYGDATFANNSSLTFESLVDGTVLITDSLSFDGTDIRALSNTTITDWNQVDYTLVETENGVSGTYTDNTINNLLSEGAKDYAGIIVTNDGFDLSYGLKWNDVSDNGNDAYGTFDLKEGATLNLGVVLADNTDAAASETSFWDGKSLIKAGYGTLILSNENKYSGLTTVAGGVLKTNVVDAFANTSGVDVASNAMINLSGNSQRLGSNGVLNNSGTVLINDWDATLLTSAVTITGDVINSGNVILNNCSNCEGQTLAVTGDWTGINGTVNFGTVLGDDNSVTDKLVIGGVVTGTTYVVINNTNGSGAQTLEGIELITTGGSDTDAFVQDGRIVAGSYDYSLQQGNASGNNLNNWYLTSKLSEEDDNTYRPEVGSYASNLAAAATMFNTRLNDRQGEGYYINGATGERDQANFWMRYEGSHNKNHMAGGQLENTGNRSVLQIGGDFLGGSFNDNDLWRLGAMAGYGHQNTKTYNKLSGHRADASLNGYTVGVYGTWYQNGQDHSGLYVDSWLQYNWFRNTVDGYQLQGEKYKSKGFSASVEGGYNFLAGTVTGLGGIEHNVFIRPQGQLTWSGVKADSHTEANGTQVYGLGHNNVQTRLGMRLSLSPSDKQASYNLEPYLEANWINNSKKYGVEMGGVKNYIEGSRNIGEVKLGLEGRFNDNLSAWGSIGHQFGSSSYKETKGIVGVKYRF